MADVPGVLNFPTALDSATSLIASANIAATTLAAPYTAGASTLTVASNVLFPTSGLLTFPTSGLILSYTGKSGLTGFTGVARASTEPNNPADASVASLAAVEQRITSGSLNVLRQALLALETKLGIGADTPTTGEFFQGTGAGSSGWSALTSGAVTTALGYTPQTPLGFTPLNYHGFLLVADDQAGADLGAKINAADTLLGANAGTILVIQTGTISTAVSISAGHLLQFGPGTFTQSAAITLAGDGAAIVGSGIKTTIVNNSSTTVDSVVIANGVTGPRVDSISLVRTGVPSSGADGIVCAGTCDQALITNVVLEAHYRGAVLGPVGYARFENSLATKSVNHGVLLANTAGLGTLQWTLSGILSSQNGQDGFCVTSIAGPSSVSLGTWSRCATYANSNHGAEFLGLVGVPINGVRINDCFFGEDGDSELYLDTYGGQHRISNCYAELCGTRTTGPTLANAATGIGRGLYASANNGYIQFSNNTCINNSYSGLWINATDTDAVGNVCVNNGLALAASERVGLRLTCSGSATAVGNLSYNASGSSQQYGIYSDSDTATLVGNTLQGSVAAIGMGAGPLVSQIVGNRILSGTIGVESFHADNLTIADAKNIVFGTTTGTQIGTAANQKWATHGATPIVQQASANQAAAPAGGTGATAGAYDTAAHRDALIALVNEMRLVLVNKGIMKGSA